MDSPSPVVELRQYTLRAGQRDTLIELFDREFVIPQESLGMQMIGQFRDLDDPDRFVWLRGFDSMETRARSLAAFYGGPVWKAHRDAANATMLDSDNVLLLRPAHLDAGFAAGARDARLAGVLTATVHYLGTSSPEDFAAFFAREWRPRIEERNVPVLAELLSEDGPNTFPALPVRGGEPVFIWFGRFDDEQSQRAFAEWLRRESGWRDAAPSPLFPAFMRKAEVLRLAPTGQSALR